MAFEINVTLHLKYQSTMQKVSFKMQLHPGQAAEYKKRHDEIWPELVALLKSVGICDYYIFLDEETYALFAILSTDDPTLIDTLPQHEVMQRWWRYMGDIMESNPDHSPVVKPLQEVFYMA
jgi:L-rhamnose mutarotase